MSMIFHQVVRYEVAKRNIELLRTKESHTILEVGAGRHGNLKKYLPKDKITFLDIDMPDELLGTGEFVRGDATNLSYEDNSYDFIIGLDVLEHIPENRRLLFLKNIIRVAREGVFISFPYINEWNSYQDELLKTYYNILGLEEPIWIDEHIECGLPAIDEVKSLLNKIDLPFDKIIFSYGVNQSLFHFMLFLEAVSSKFPAFEKYFEIVNKCYIENIMQYDWADQEQKCTKAYILMSKKAENISEVKISNSKCADKVEQFYQKIMDESNRIFVSMYLNGEKNLLTRDQWIKKDKIRLNIILITYNHEKYICESLESILKQKTDFKFNIYVADDCSSDNTVDIIKKYASNSKVDFYFLDNHENLGTMKNYKRAFAKCTAEYTAIMEGDDIWNDEYRLQKMVDFLDNNRDCAMAFSQYIVKDFQNDISYVQPVFSVEQEKQGYVKFTGHDLAFDNLIGNFSACLYRTDNLHKLPEDFWNIPGYDWITNLVISKNGKLGCLVSAMSTYRIHTGGLWSGKSQAEKNKDLIEKIDIYNKYTNYEYNEGFLAYKRRINHQEFLPNKLKQAILKCTNVVYRFCPPILVQIILALIPPAFIKNKGE